MAGRALENARRFHELFELSVRDPLTGLHNRHYFHETLAQEVKRAHRYDRRLALIFFDIDDFKAINEEIGHLGGDAVLAEVAQRLRSVVRGADLPCRVGGDEFAVRAPRVVDRRGSAPVPAPPARGSGPADRPRPDGSSVRRDRRARARRRQHVALQRVDQALYRAKRSGKGTVVAARTQASSSSRLSRRPLPLPLPLPFVACPVVAPLFAGGRRGCRVPPSRRSPSPASEVSPHGGGGMAAGLGGGFGVTALLPRRTAGGRLRLRLRLRLHAGGVPRSRQRRSGDGPGATSAQPVAAAPAGGDRLAAAGSTVVVGGGAEGAPSVRRGRRWWAQAWCASSRDLE